MAHAHLPQLKVQMHGYVNFCNLFGICAYKFLEPMAKSDVAEAAGFIIIIILSFLFSHGWFA